MTDKDAIISDLREQLLSAARWIEFEWRRGSELHAGSASFVLDGERHEMDMAKIRTALLASEAWRKQS